MKSECDQRGEGINGRVCGAVLLFLFLWINAARGRWSASLRVDRAH